MKDVFYQKFVVATLVATSNQTSFPNVYGLMSGPANGEIEQIYAEVGRRIRRVRTRANLTQASLAAKTPSLSRTSIANIERGEQRMMLHSLVELAGALRVPVSKLIPSEPLADMERAHNMIGAIEDQAAASFVTAGLLKAKVIK